MNEPQSFTNETPTPRFNQRVYRLGCQDHAEPRLVNFYDPEEFEGKVFRWSKPVAMIRLEVPVDDYQVAIETSGLRGEDCNFHFELIWNDQQIPRESISVKAGQIKFPVTRSMFVSNREQRLTITCKSLDAEKGRRQLGMPIAWVELIAHHGGLEYSHRPLATGQSSHHKIHLKGIKRRWRRKAPGPNLPIWQVEMPQLTALKPVHLEPDDDTPCHCDTVVVSSVEVNARHGTGLLVQYLFKDFSNMATVISQRCYDGDRVRSAAHYELPRRDLNRHEIYRIVHDWFQDVPPRRAYVVPFFKTDLLIGIALKDLFQTEICLHIMDDNCLYDDEIPHDVAEEAIRKSDLTFAISAEMRNAYQQRFGMKVWVLPPIVPDCLITEDESELNSRSPAVGSKQRWTSQWLMNVTQWWRENRTNKRRHDRGILIGNIWDKSWLQMLRDTVRESGFQVDWYCNNPEAVWLEESTAELDRDGIFLHDALWGNELVEELRSRPFALMPSGILAQTEMRESIARLSLPSRIPFVVATSQIPVIVLGSRETCAARFIERFQLGCVADYNGESFRQAAEQVLDPQRQESIRSRGREIAATFSDRSLEDWMWRSLESGVPADERFEKLFAPQRGEFSFFLDARCPKKIHWDKRPLWQMLRRLKGQGIDPELILDVGASDGIWSSTASHVYPDAKYVLVDPLLTRYNPQHRAYHLQRLKNHELVEAALSDHSGTTEILVSDDLYGSSLINVNQSLRKTETAVVDVMTLDQLAQQRGWAGKSTLIKLDVQFAEHLVILGGLGFIADNVDTLILELTLQREHPDAKTYQEMVEMMSELGFQLIDESDGWRNPRTGILEQKDAVFQRSKVQSATLSATRAA